MADHDAQLATLISMGYDVFEAERALKATDGDIDNALKYLVAGGKSVRSKHESCLSPDSLASPKQKESKKSKRHHSHSHKKGGKKNQHDGADGDDEKSKHHTRARQRRPDLDDVALTNLDDGTNTKYQAKKARLPDTDGRDMTSNENVATNECGEPRVAEPRSPTQTLFPGAYREGEDESFDLEANTLFGSDLIFARQTTEQEQSPDQPYMAVADVVEEPVLVESKPSGWWSSRRNCLFVFGAVLLVVAGLVAAVVELSPKGAALTPESSNPPNGTNQTHCYTNLSKLDEDERNAMDIDVTRTYVHCANTTFFTGFLTINNGDILGGDKPITLRRKMRILCGSDGTSSNNCTVTRGTYLLMSI